MIRNDAQLRHAEDRLKEIYETIEQFAQLHSGRELRFFTDSLEQEAEERRAEIEEYLQLRDQTLEEAIQGVLREPSLLGNIGELLTKLRIAADLTQQELADRLGWHQSNLSRFESENYSSQTIAKVVEYATALGVWLHVSPSLTEEPTEVTLREERIPQYADDTTQAFVDIAHRQELVLSSTASSLGRQEEDLLSWGISAEREKTRVLA